MARQCSLFDDEPPGNALIRVGIIGTSKALTKAQRAFNRWTRRIESQKAELAGWRACLETFQQRVAGDYEPLRRKLLEQQRALLQRFDQAWGGGALSKREQTKLGRFIAGQAASLLEQGDDPDLIALHDKYAGESFADQREAQTRSLQASVEAMLGTSLGEGLQSPDEVMAAARDAADKGMGQGMGQAAGEAAGDPDPGPRSTRAQARMAREKALADGATRSLRETYRRLASVLHPDRERDPVQRERKTALMQRANQAYEARDLMQLLALQIEASQVDLRGLAEASDERLEHFNRVLKEQSEALALEIDDLVDGFGFEGAGRGAGKLTPAVVLEALNRDIAALRHDVRSLASDLDQFRDILVLKAWLKSLRQSRRPVDDDLDPVDLLEALLAARAARAGADAADAADEAWEDGGAFEAPASRRAGQTASRRRRKPSGR